MSAAADSAVAQQRRRADRVWHLNGAFDPIYQDAYDFVIPQRKPGGNHTSKQIYNKLFDMTGPVSAMVLADRLAAMLFAKPPQLQPGTLIKRALELEGREGARKLSEIERELEKTGGFMGDFMMAGDLETSAHEACIDLGVGTACIIPMRGTPDQPVVFHTPPANEVALGGDAFGRVGFASWKRTVERGALLEAFPDGNFSDEFKKSAAAAPYGEVQLYQDFFKRPDGLWQFCAYTDRDCHDWIAKETTRTKPISTQRYYRCAGELRGRGLILLALPGIKTVNKAQELALKAAAINMLGIWGYRPGGAFNPNTAGLQPGSFWPLQSTGGVQGPDVTRLDPASGRLDIAQLIIEGTQQQIRDVLQDTRLIPERGTPRSASEIAGLMRQNARAHLGGYMRLHLETYPELVPRTAEILHSFGYLKGLMDFNRLLISVGVRSPMASALNADELNNLGTYIELIGAMVGPQKLPEHLLVDQATDEMADDLMVPKRLVPTPAQREEIRQAQAAQNAEGQLAAVAEKAAPQVAAGAMRLIEGGREAA